MHLEVRILFERFDRHECAAFAKREPRFGAAIVALLPALRDERRDFFSRLHRARSGARRSIPRAA